jgi:23S rRNA (cytidine1920-2'-O)/16S rRNA (cytidine1409-2'-O)-methyltransferase
MKEKKIRLDMLVVERGLAGSRTKAQALIMAGEVEVEGKITDKPGHLISPAALVAIKEKLPYVSRGGVKLEGAIEDFNIDVCGLTVMDVGASTGGFTDCLLKRGAKKVHAIDVGRGLMDARLRRDPRVSLLEGRNIRYLSEEEIGEKVDLAVADVSFISLKKVIPALKGFLKDGGRLLTLIKPQFEVGIGEVGKGGIVKDPEKHRKVIEELKGFSISEGFSVLGVTESPVKGAKGNKEFWLHLGKA